MNIEQSLDAWGMLKGQVISYLLVCFVMQKVRCDEAKRVASQG